MKNLDELVMRLKRYNEWRRGAEYEQPNPAEIGRDIDEVIAILERKMSDGLRGDDCNEQAPDRTSS